MYRPPVPLAWNKGDSKNSPLSNGSGNYNAKESCSKTVDKLPSWLDLSCHHTLPQVIALKRHLLRTLPVELVHIILSFAEYWPHLSNYSSAPRTIKGKKPHLSPPRTFAELRPRLSELTGPPILSHPHTKDNLLVQSAPLGLSHEISQPWFPPRTRHPARMLVVEVTARRVIPTQQVFQPSSLFRKSHTWLEISVLNPTSPLPKTPLLSLPDAEREARNLLPKRQLRGIESIVYLQCERAYYAWLEQRNSRAPGSLRVNLYVNDFPEGETKTITSIYRFNDEDAAHSNLTGPDWGLWSGAGTEVTDFVKRLDDVNRRDGADFVRALQVGDEIGVWIRTNARDNVTVVEGVRVTVFWEV